MKKIIAVALVLVMCLSLIPAAFAADDLIKVCVVNNPPSESGYREANVNDFISVFTEENGYDASFFYSIKTMSSSVPPASSSPMASTTC